MAIINPCRAGFSGQLYRTGLLAIVACALITWIYRRSIQGFFYPATPLHKNIAPFQDSPTKKLMPRNFKAIQVPNDTNLPYQGSNAEYTRCASFPKRKIAHEIIEK